MSRRRTAFAVRVPALVMGLRPRSELRLLAPVVLVSLEDDASPRTCSTAYTAVPTGWMAISVGLAAAGLLVHDDTSFMWDRRSTLLLAQVTFTVRFVELSYLATWRSSSRSRLPVTRRAVEGENHVVGSEGVAVAELHPLRRWKNPLRGRRRSRPALCPKRARASRLC